MLIIQITQIFKTMIDNVKQHRLQQYLLPVSVIDVDSRRTDLQLAKYYLQGNKNERKLSCDHSWWRKPRTFRPGDFSQLHMPVSPQKSLTCALKLDIVRDGIQYQIVQLRDGTQYQIAQAQEVHRRTLKGFNETNLLERTLIQQIKETVKRDCIEV